MKRRSACTISPAVRRHAKPRPDALHASKDLPALGGRTQPASPPHAAAEAARLYRIDNPGSRGFCAGVLVNPATGIVSKTAPILAWTVGKHISWLVRYCKRKGWDIRGSREYQSNSEPSYL